MNIGVAQIEITPPIGVELSGFTLRTQPSIGMLDRLWVRGLFLEDAATRLLWLHCDLIGFDERIVAAFRNWAREQLGVAEAEILLSATHTHSGPCTIRLEEAGAYDDRYVAWLQLRLQEAARIAMHRIAPCTVCTVEAELDLAVDRRNQPSAHTDPRMGVLGFQRNDGAFAAVVVNCAVHPVALGHENRRISADLFGTAADELTRRLPGAPVALVTNGACGNLNPPAVNVTCAQLEEWGRRIAGAALSRLDAAEAHARSPLRVVTARCRLPLDALDHAGIGEYAARIAADPGGHPEWRAKVRQAAEQWRRSLVAALDCGRALTQREIEIFAVQIGDVTLLGANAELFSNFTDWLRRDTGMRVYTLGYANGNCGYICPRSAHVEGGYEVEIAHLFYGCYRFRSGGLERLADEAAGLLRREFGQAEIVRLPVVPNASAPASASEP